VTGSKEIRGKDSQQETAD